MSQQSLMCTDDKGSKQWYNADGELHRIGAPAVEWVNGTKLWYENDKLHREDAPAIEYASGSKEWYVHGKLHRLDGAAIENADGTKSWFLHGRLHRTNGAAIEYFDGTKIWYVAGVGYAQIEEWAKAALQYQGIAVTEAMIEQKIMQMMQCDLF